jgi:hypothetical protein
MILVVRGKDNEVDTFSVSKLEQAPSGRDMILFDSNGNHVGSIPINNYILELLPDIK